jgi:hypothetical protein
MASIETLSVQISDGVTTTLRRVGSLALVATLIAAVIGTATFATGLAVFDGDGRPLWLTIGLVGCAIPTAAALVGWFFVRTARRSAPQLLGNVRSLLDESHDRAKLLIDHDSGQPLAVAAKSLSSLRSELLERKRELPALFSGVRAITSVPGLSAIAILGTLLVGGLGTILLIGLLID